MISALRTVSTAAIFAGVTCLTDVAQAAPAAAMLGGDPFGVTLEQSVPALPGADAFGRHAVALDGDTLAVSQRSGFSAGSMASVYVFTRTGVTWTHQSTITSSDLESEDFFGASIALSGDLLVVGAPRHDGGLGTHAGAAYVFRRSGDNWSEEAKLTAPVPETWDRFGQAVAIDGTTAVVGDDKWFTAQAPSVGSAHVFVRDSTSGLWSVQATLRPLDLGHGDKFGSSLALDGNTLLVAAPRYPDPSTGGVFVFVRSGSVWTQQQVLFASDAEVGLEFGWKVALEGDRAAVTSRYWNGPVVPFADNYGAAYVFDWANGVWTEQARVSPLEEDSEFGYQVALSDDVMWVGAYASDGPNGQDQGAAYVYELSGGVWSQQSRIALDDAVNAELFGIAMAVDGDTVAISNADTTTTPALNLGTVSIYRFGEEALAAPFCFGDGSLATPCPCAPPDTVPNPSGASDAGCANSFDLDGAKLTASGMSSPDTLQFHVDVGPSYAGFAFLVKGNAQDVNGIVGGDGVRCVSGQLIRFGSHNAGTNGAPLGSWTYPNTAQTTPVSSATLQPAGQETFYQLFYRNAQSGFCSPATSNFSNGLHLSWPL